MAQSLLNRKLQDEVEVSVHSATDVVAAGVGKKRYRIDSIAPYKTA